MVNGSDTVPAVVTVEDLAYDGSVVDSPQQGNVPPRGTYFLIGSGSAASCRITVLAGNKKSIHAVATYVRSYVGGIDMVVPAR